MRKIFKISIIALGLFSTVGCSDAANEFQTCTVSKDGKLDWNDIKEANYYQIKFGGKEHWSDDSEFDLSSMEIKDFEVKTVTVKAFVSKAFVGQMDVDPLEVNIAKCGNDFYIEEDIPRYNVTVKYQYGSQPVTINDKWKICSYDLGSPSLKDSFGESIYVLDGYYLDAAYTKKMDDNYILVESNITIYAKVSKQTKEITFNVYNEKDNTTTVLKKTKFDIDTTFTLSAYSELLPTVSGCYFCGWKTSKSKYEDYLDANAKIKVTEARTEYYAFILKDVKVTITSSQYVDAKNYGSFTLHNGDLLTESMIKKYNSNSYTSYYCCEELFEKDDWASALVYPKIIKLPYEVTCDVFIYGYSSI